MKKMLLIASIACATMVANAANISWGVATMTIPGLKGEEWGAIGATVYLLEGIPNAAVGAAIENGTFNTLYGSSIKGTPLTTNNGGGTPPAATGFATAGVTLDLFVVVFGTDAAGKEYYMVSSAKEGLTYEPPATGTAVTFRVADFPDGWKPVPEPATMALLGIGIVAVGLRRRRK